jgi:hypothetical protein
LLQDFGARWLAVVALAAFAVVGLALADTVRTRHVYLSLAMFHGYLELALLAYFWARRGALNGATA